MQYCNQKPMDPGGADPGLLIKDSGIVINGPANEQPTEQKPPEHCHLCIGWRDTLKAIITGEYEKACMYRECKGFIRRRRNAFGVMIDDGKDTPSVFRAVE